MTCVYAYLANGEFGFKARANAYTSCSMLSSLPGYKSGMLGGGGYETSTFCLIIDVVELGMMHDAQALEPSQRRTEAAPSLQRNRGN